jgi:hypothetical protein
MGTHDLGKDKPLGEVGTRYLGKEKLLREASKHDLWKTNPWEGGHT